MTIIEQIKAEIERRKGYYRITNPYDKRAIRVCENLLSFLSTLESEKPMQEGLEEEIDACWQSWLSPSNQKEVEGVLPKTEFAMYARHFYELGKQNTIEELLHDRPKDPRMED